jgi:hypothetical protein
VHDLCEEADVDDSNKGRIVRMFRCQCGEQTWASDLA